MTPVGHHPLVGQLLHSAGASESEAPSLETWRDLLARMSQMYYETDQDRDELESSIESSSREMQRLYQELKQKAEAERAEQDAILRATLESAKECILVVDNQHGVIAVKGARSPHTFSAKPCMLTQRRTPTPMDAIFFRPIQTPVCPSLRPAWTP